MIPWKRAWQPTPVYLPGESHLWFWAWWATVHGIAKGQIRLKVTGEGNGTPLQYSCLENPRDGGALRSAVHEVAKSRTRLSNFTFTFHFYALEKEMATHSSVLPWRIPGTGEPGGLPSMGSHRVGHDWSDLAAAAAAFSLPVPKCPILCMQNIRIRKETWPSPSWSSV